MGALHLFLGLIIMVFASAYLRNSQPSLSLTSRAWISGGPCPRGISLNVLETFREQDPLGAFEINSPSKFFKLMQATSCMNEYAVTTVNALREAEASKKNETKKSLKLGTKYLQLAALNNSVLMSKFGKARGQDLDAMNARGHCSTFISGETVGVGRINASDTEPTNPAKMCIDKWTNSPQHYDVLVQPVHKEAVAGFYVDGRGIVWCTMIFSIRSNFAQAPDCAESKWVLPSPTPSVTPTISVTPRPTPSISLTPSPTISTSPTSSMSFIPISTRTAAPTSRLIRLIPTKSAIPPTPPLLVPMTTKTAVISASATPATVTAFQPTLATTPTVFASPISAQLPGQRKRTIAPTFSPLPSLLKKIVVPDNLETHKFKNTQVLYILMDGSEILLDLKCKGDDCMYCMFQANENWCFNTYFTVYMDIYISSKP